MQHCIRGRISSRRLKSVNPLVRLYRWLAVLGPYSVLNVRSKHLTWRWAYCRYEVYVNGTLIIDDVDVGDDGVYRCVGLSATSSAPQQVFATRLRLACKCPPLSVCLSLSLSLCLSVFDRQTNGSAVKFSSSWQYTVHRVTISFIPRQRTDIQYTQN